MSINIFSTVYGSIDGIIVSTVTSGYDAVAGYAAQALIAGIGVYMVVACYAVLRGIAGEGFGHVLTQGVKASLVLAAVQGGLGGVAARSVMDWPGVLAGLAGSNVGNPGAMADQLVNKIIESVSALITPLSAQISFATFDPTQIGAALVLSSVVAVLMLLALIPLILAGIVGTVITVMLLFLKFGLAVAALFGPIFVALLLFDSTRGMFFTWLGSALSYALGTVVIGLAIRVVNQAILSLVDAEVGKIAGIGSAIGASGGDLGAGVGAVVGGSLDAIFGFLAISIILIVGFVFLIQASSIAQGLAGGGGGSSGAVAGALIPSSYTVRSGVNALRTGANSLARGAAATARGGARLATATPGAASRAISNINVMRGNGSAAAFAARAAAV